MIVVVDTNVLVVANDRDVPQASPACIAACSKALNAVMSDQSRLTIDDGFYILNEYMRNVRQEGQPGVGDAFLKWTLINRSNPARVMQVALTAIPWSKTAGRDPDFREFPDDPRLAAFDRSDRKFAAVALTHPDCPPVQVATDTDWWEHRKSLAEHGITIDFLCETDIRRLAAKP